MSLYDALTISASGLAVQRTRLDVASENIANVNSTRTPEGGPYRHKSVMVSSAPMAFDLSLQKFLRPAEVTGAQVMGVAKDNTPPKTIYNPNHPDANEQGIVELPNVNVTQEMVDIMTASRNYEANITVMNAAKSMALRTIEGSS